MRTGVNARRRPGFYRPNKDPVKLTALLYLREALISERYEECAFFIATALEFGASASEIDNILEDPKRAVYA